jgi:hypothetical protein
MTLCIAAVCTHNNNEPAIVLCSDWRAETGDVAGGDVQDKLSWIVPWKWAALKAGIIADADRVVEAFAVLFQQFPEPITLGNVRPLMDIGFQKYRWRITDDYLRARLAVDYASLLGGVKVEVDKPNLMFPEAFVEEKLHEVENIPIPNCLLIVAGFVEGIPIICVVNEPDNGSGSYCRTRFESNFAAIGSGAPAALISLYRREHTATDVPLMKAVYHAYEAKLSGEVSPGVGDATSITVLFPDGTCWNLSTAGFRYIEERYAYFGPMRIGNKKRPKLNPPFFSFKEEYFNDYAFPWDMDVPNNPMSSPSDQT